MLYIYKLVKKKQLKRRRKNKSKKYLFEFVNNSGQTIVFNVKTLIYEVGE